MHKLGLRITEVGAAVAFWLTMVGLSPLPKAADGGTYQDVSTGLCLDSNSEGRVYTLGCNDGSYQSWQLTRMDTGTELINKVPHGLPNGGITGRILELVNQQRAAAGEAPLSLNIQLTNAAQQHTQDMADHKFSSHSGSDGSTPSARVTRSGYNWSATAENVADGDALPTPDDAMAAWMKSAGHRENILNPQYRDIGDWARGQWIRTLLDAGVRQTINGMSGNILPDQNRYRHYGTTFPMPRFDMT